MRFNNFGIRLSQKFKNYFLRIVLRQLNLVFGKVRIPPTKEQLKDFKQSGLFSSSEKIDIFYAYQKMEEADIFDAQGLYFKSTQIRSEVMEYIYNALDLSHSEWTPKFISHGYSTAVGHRALLGLLLDAQNFGLIPTSHRTIFTDYSDSADQLKILFSGSKGFEMVKLSQGFRVFENPNFWHLAERVKVIKTQKSFMSDIELTEQVNSLRIKSNLRTYLPLSDDYLNKSQSLISEYGLPKNAPFVALHLRNKSKYTLDDTRVVSNNNYELAIKKIVEKGYWVIQFGTDKVEKVIEHPKVIRIPNSSSVNVLLTPFIISHCKFFINTCSGPTHLAPLFNTPVLQTNVIALGKNTCTLTRESMHLPKKWKINGSPMSFSQLLNSTEGYSDTGLKNLKSKGIELIENSSREIYEATNDMLTMLESGDIPDVPKIIEEIREYYKSPVHGQIAKSFLSEHGKWFLK